MRKPSLAERMRKPTLLERMGRKSTLAERMSQPAEPLNNQFKRQDPPSKPVSSQVVLLSSDWLPLEIPFSSTTVNKAPQPITESISQTGRNAEQKDQQWVVPQQVRMHRHF
jgi:hypothetical protein